MHLSQALSSWCNLAAPHSWLITPHHQLFGQTPVATCSLLAWRSKAILNPYQHTRLL